MRRGDLRSKQRGNRSGSELKTTKEAKPDSLGEKPPVVETKTKAKGTALVVKVVVGPARPPSFGGPRHHARRRVGAQDN
ncbi:hypothetical protein ABZP36_018197 [Zizania latifolia]